MFRYQFYESRLNNLLSYGYYPHFTHIYHFWEKRVVKIDLKGVAAD